MVAVSKVAFFCVAAMALLTEVDAYCPNGCNAQGTCGKNDKCTCYMRQDQEDWTYPAYKGADCSLRTCPYGDAWVSVPTATNIAQAKAECSNRGLCDYGTGRCACFPGYEGKACERTECPNDCNSHGICLTIAAIIAGAPTPPATYAAWDANKQMGCYCDQGAQGRDCGGRGKCNTESGDCECFPGYYGTACESQTTVN
ncbi:hypothetical protein BBO99_00002677 [Phytophthora kernoviae]|uniref:EGF-like domain-containing protein n=2 Tax=Phytophthora kernoviae TaxID=325452 RepID=A0A3R7H2D5_9STRA|nr:hypothetical protein G195_003824 [Phytophthora kernoviae 00238/432]KAG2527925.1 hypothetical protein JM16_002402 [Phytophthora kernoviae]KAG2529393.1 hypothetical protein JM18_002809 [Phytophthora kernoviae]RLN36654.1 hypothetical protein BBI17_002684 [Phytophthora kernoviae]RLN82733.1 hypothetical protein BBO99_00002677 [Phytophthora kernoviae]